MKVSREVSTYLIWQQTLTANVKPHSVYLTALLFSYRTLLFWNNMKEVSDAVAERLGTVQRYSILFKLGQIAHTGDKSWTFSVHFGSSNLNVLKSDLKYP